MQNAVPLGEGAMTALIGADIETAEAVAKDAAVQGGICVVANDNAPGQVVLSGSKDAMDRVADIAKAKGVKRAIPLTVSAPFHCPLMQPAADAMPSALAKVAVRPLAVPVLANVTASETAEPEMVRRLLVEQVTGRVRWRESVLALRGLGVETTVEMGGNKVLTGMVKRIDKDLQTVTLDTPDEIETFAKAL
jgi:[acyl-carrier-protein] S-malonyltransferase